MRFRIEHKWLRFSLRSVLIGVALACVWLGWQAYRVHERKTLREWLTWRDAVCSVERPGPYQPDLSDQAPPGWGEAPWIRRMMGDEGVFVIELPTNVPDDDRRRVTRAFPEAIVEPFPAGDLNRKPLTDEQYVEVKRRQAIQAKFHRLLSTDVEPSMADLIAIAPWLVDDLVERVSAALKQNVVTVCYAVDSLLLTSELRTCLAPGDATTNAKSKHAELAENLRRLQVILDEQSPRPNAPQPDARRSTRDFGQRLIEYESERCAAAEARLNHDAHEETEALSRAVAGAERLRAAADEAWRAHDIALTDLTGALRRAWQAKTAQASLANDAAAARAALLEYGAALQEIRAQVKALYDQGVVGGEAEKFYHLSYCAAEQAALLAEMDSDRDATIASWRLACEQADWALKATQVAFDANTVTVDALVQAINLQSKARRQLAKLQTDKQGVQSARDEQLRQLLKLARKRYAVLICSAAGSGMETTIDFVAGHYMLSRCRAAE